MHEKTKEDWVLCLRHSVWPFPRKRPKIQIVMFIYKYCTFAVYTNLPLYIKTQNDCLQLKSNTMTLQE